MEAGSAGPSTSGAQPTPAPAPAPVSDVETGTAPKPPPAAAAAPASAAASAASFGTPEEEVTRLLRVENLNYYAVLKVEPADTANLRKNYLKLSRLVHPDKCSHPDAAKAQSVVTQAYDTLNNPVKKKLYDAYTTKVDTTKPDGMSYAEWESRQVEIPRWVERILRIPGGRVCLLPCLIPLLLILFILVFIVWIICLPFHCCLRICCGVKPEEEEQGEETAANGSVPDAANNV